MRKKIEVFQQLDEMGIRNINDVYYNTSTPGLYERAIRRREGVIAHLGPLVVRTGQHTGRSPNDKFIVREPTSEHHIWWGKVNIPISEEKYRNIYNKMLSFIQNKDLYVQDCYAGADPAFRLPIRIITETAWHSLFSRNMFIQVKDDDELAGHKPSFTVINMPEFRADPSEDGTNSEVFIIVNFGKRLVLIGGTSYAGEIKKSIFTVLNYFLPLEKVMSMHCSANVGNDGDVAVLFGLSGTGKTTLSADPNRKLIGDDEHGWSDKGVFNYEGGCYAKVIRLSKEAEPEIFDCTRKFGTLLENVSLDAKSRFLNLDDAVLTENTRAAYPLTHLKNIVASGMADHPKNIVMLTADAFGVLPPVAKLTSQQAMYHFLSGYTAKVAGTEKGVTEPKATFSTCFGAPFMALHPSVYAKLLGEKIKKHNVKCWLINTGWSAGPYGEGSRIKIVHTRRMLNAALSGELENVPCTEDKNFGFLVPEVCPDIPSSMLSTRNTWTDKERYDRSAQKLADMFKENFKIFEADVTDEIKKAGPR